MKSNGILKYMPVRIQKLINELNEETVKNLREIRIRKNAPMSMVISGQQYFVDEFCNLSVKRIKYPFITTSDEFDESLSKVTGYSFFSHTEEIKNGFITLPEGDRVGICGKAVYDTNGNIYSVTDITALIFRISRNFNGVSQNLITQIFQNGLQGTIIAGPPGSGKTTLLKDIAVQLSNGYMGKSYSVALVDERYEIAGREKANNSFEVLSGFPKATGILQAVRTLSPDVVICDELGNKNETEAIISGLNSGVPIITTIHAKYAQECINKPQIKTLIDHSAFEYLVILKGKEDPTEIKEILKRDELIYENNRNFSNNDIDTSVWQFQI